MKRVVDHCVKGLCAIAAFALTACSQPDRRDIAGTWTVVESTPDAIEVFPGDTVYVDKNLRVVLGADGSFRVLGWPGTLLPFREGKESVTGEGTWTYECSMWGSPMVRMKFHRINDSISHTGTYVFVSDRLNDLDFGETKLYCYLGDPDGGERLEFKKLRTGDLDSMGDSGR